ncbi:Cap1p NDAI_0K02480 [Naumovozyma dairenensis CBS 421]|uniref:F-actin-capping protein subunit alpha n=1 Tax=Naumovozyma dairenensis (strain ATCC 10597 / BCRC 20456 / CBS 421 / NBRC 0211 / NRRL Y-12639) TaxID=1071378 RepID=G0WI28_NAUDC|nr:hypothetical protein NDAI_0K02480 [Naumovozyma dairenensis CBS 421]CCD27439.1 hypothetical protein NDAI_0K02480 [Naumovozyma dairenensis CBS 421]
MSKFETIINEIVESCPPGEIESIYSDLLKITGSDNETRILDSIKVHNVKTISTISIPSLGNKKFIISEHNVDDSKFVDYNNHIRFSVDHLKFEGIDVEEDVEGLELNDDQMKIFNDLEKYVKVGFPNDDATIGVFPDKNESSSSFSSSKIHIIIVSEVFNPNNYWNGSWKSQYVYDTNNKKLSGDITVQIHYFEDGNVNFTSKKDIDNVSLNDNENVVDDVIKKLETDFEKELDVSFTNLNEKQFKSLRRRLPITRSKVNWGKAIGNYRLGRDAANGLQ